MLPNSRPYREIRLVAGQTGQYFTPISHHLAPLESAYLLEDREARLVVVDASLLDVAGLALDELAFPNDHRFAVGGAAGWRDYEELFTGFPATIEKSVRGRLHGLYLGYAGQTQGGAQAAVDGPPEVSQHMLNFMACAGELVQ